MSLRVLVVFDGLPVRFGMTFAYRSTVNSSANSLRISWDLMGIYRELQAQGYQGSYENVRVQFADPSQKAGTKRGARSLPTEALPSSRQASWLFLCRPEDLTAKEQATVDRLRQLHPELDLACVLVQQFAQMLRTRTGEQLDSVSPCQEDSLVLLTMPPLLVQSGDDEDRHGRVRSDTG